MPIHRFDTCEVCGGKEEDHHAFKPKTIIIPNGCKCYNDGWGDPDRIPPICESFEALASDSGVCGKCEHNEECHERTSK